MLKILNVNCNTVGTDKDGKGANCKMRKDSVLGAGSEQCSANTGLERSCAKTDSNTSCYTNSGSNSNLNNRLDDVLIPVVNNNEIECSIPGPNTETNANNPGNSNFNGRADNTPYQTIMKSNISLLGLSKKSDKKASTEITKQLQKEFEDVFTGIGCFDGTFSFKVKPDSKQYQVPSWYLAYTFQKQFKEELERLQQQNIITPLGIDKMVEWGNSFILVPKPNGKVRLCLDPARLN